MSFHREKYVAKGGPDGGDGGNGGSVIFVADPSMNTLYSFKLKHHFRAENGENGGASNCTGKTAPDLIIKVPVGSVIKDKETGNIIADLVEEGQSEIVLKGGRGGKGNARFATSTRKAPNFSQRGEKTEEHTVIIELKTIADVGLVGMPNVGKSTILSVTTNARPKIANYHFTTLSPNLGVVNYYDQSCVVADIPGLIEGASEGIGLGYDFLRHIERVRLIVHIVDISAIEGRDPYEDYITINNELNNYYNCDLSNVPQIVVANKSDLLTDDTAYIKFKDKVNQEVFLVSAISNSGLQALIKEIFNKLKDIPKPAFIEFEKFSYDRQLTTDYEIVNDSEGKYEIIGDLVEILSRNVVLSDYESFSYFQKKLKEHGVFKALVKAGIAEGDTVKISDIEFEYII